MNLKKIFDIDWLKTIKIKFHNSKKGMAIIYRNSAVNLANDSSICLSERFEFGRRYYRQDNRTSALSLAGNAKLIVTGAEQIYTGAYITVAPNAVLSFGGGYCNNNLTIDCFERIAIGKGVFISKNVTIRDSDNHLMCYDGYEKTKPIMISDHVWIGMNVTILKGVTIGEGAVIAAGSVVTRDIPPHALGAGVPCRVIKTGIEWKDK